MTVSEMADAIFSKMGFTATSAGTSRVTDVFRMLNVAKDKFVNQNKWSFLESSANHLWTTSQRAYPMTSVVGHIVSLEKADGTPLEQTERRAYDELFRAASDTATAPTRYAEQGADSNSLLQVSVWPTPTTDTTGKVRFLTRVPDVANAGSTGSFEQIPENHHYTILAIAEAEWARYEDAGELQIIEGNAQASSGQLAASHASPVADDGTA